MNLFILNIVGSSLLSWKKQLATQNTEITEDKQMVVVNNDFTHQVILKNMWDPLSVGVLWCSY